VQAKVSDCPGAAADPPSPPHPASLAEPVRRAALALGFARVGFASADSFDEARQRLLAWLANGHQGGLTYLTGPDDRASPRALLPSARTIIVAALPYGGRPIALRRHRDAPSALVGAMARYAVGADYHRVVKDKLEALAARCAELAGRDVAFRACVDSAPLLEREAARRAGVGFTGKSTMTIAPGLGTYFVLGELLVDLALPPDEPVAAGCGRCTACLEACPTGAFVGPYELDARRCISYLTIETKDAIPPALRPLIGSRVFGCDVCQDVCPFNASESPRPAAPELAPRPALAAPELVSLLTLGAAGYRKLVKQSALRRVGKHQLQRNAAVALGNTGDPRAVAPLARCLATEPSALVRAHAAWALGRLGGPEAAAALEGALARDSDASVRDEARAALSTLVAGADRPV
jgi:epoxyqueuosine reductase